MPRKKTRALRLWLTATHEVDQAWVKHNDSGFEVKRQIIVPSISFHTVFTWWLLKFNLWKTCENGTNKPWRPFLSCSEDLVDITWCLSAGWVETVAKNLPLQIFSPRCSIAERAFYILCLYGVLSGWCGKVSMIQNWIPYHQEIIAVTCAPKKKKEKKKSLFVFVALRSRVLLILASVVRQRQM